MATKRNPKKPRKDFPLTLHPSGQWCKKFKGRLWYFGRDWKAAEAKYLEEKEYLQAGQLPPSRREMPDGYTLADIVNLFLTHKKAGIAAGEVGQTTYRDYKDIGAQVLDHFGRTVDPTQLTPIEFAAFRTKVAAKYAPSRLTKIVTVTKMIFSHAVEMDAIDKLPKFGKSFKGASKRAIRQRKNEMPKAFTIEEVRRLIDKADPTMKAAILMGINCGFGNNDISLLPKSAIVDGWVNFPRPKTGIQRRAKLWPETIAALEAMPKPVPKNGFEDRVFLTRTGGEFVDIQSTGSRKDYIAPRMERLMKKCKCNERGRGYYGLRHTLETVGGGAKDQVALNYVMGHVDDSMSDNDRHGIEDDRLQAVTDHVREQLFPVISSESPVVSEADDAA